MKVRETIGAALVAITFLHIVVGIPIYLAESVEAGLLASGIIIVVISLIGLGVWLMTTPAKPKK